MNETQDSKPLIELSQRLAYLMQSVGLSQQYISKQTGVDQPTISLAYRGRLKRYTHKTKILWEYVNSYDTRWELSTELEESVFGFIGHGGREAELIALITQATKLIRDRRSGPMIIKH